jgi:hypothetical protein
MLKPNDFKQFRIRFSFGLSMIFPENRRPPSGIMLYAATAPLFVSVYGEPLRSPIMIACYDHIVTSSTIIPVGLAIAGAAIAAMRMRPFMTKLRVQSKK